MCKKEGNRIVPTEKDKAELNDFPPNYFEVMNIHLNDWTARNDDMWKQVFTYFIAILFVDVFPYVGPKDYPILGKYYFIFPIIGIALSVVFRILLRMYHVRIKSIGETYRGLVNGLPESFQTKTIPSNSLMGKSMTSIISIVFPSLTALASVFSLLVEFGCFAK